jgi:hypothetical protein
LKNELKAKKKKVESVAQVVESLPSKLKTLCITKKKKEKSKTF